MNKESAAKKLQNFHRESSTLTAVVLTIVNAAFLVWIGHLTFIYATFYEMGLPLGMNPSRNLLFYVNLEGWSISLVQLLFFIAVLAVTAVILGSKIYLEHSKARIRQRILLGLFSFILLGYTFGLCLMENLIFETAKRELIYLEDDELYESYYDRAWRVESRERKIEKMKTVLENYQNSKK